MLKYRTSGDIFTEEVEAIVNTVNCVGVMGRGIALQFKNTFPENYKAYADACNKGTLRLGRVFTYHVGKFSYPHYIINFPTKHHWRDKSDIKDIDSGLNSLIEEIKKLNIQSIAIPALGCGLGGLEWEQVKQKIENHFKKLSQIHTIVFRPRI